VISIGEYIIGSYNQSNFIFSPMKDSSGFIHDSGMKRLIDKSDNDERERITNWISATECADVLEKHLSDKQDGTGVWLLKSIKFHKWMMKKNNVLYCPGIPGAGKTMMASIIIDHLQEIFEDKNVGIAYVFCHHQRESSLYSIFASILKQLVQSLPTIPEQLHKLYRCRHRRNKLRADDQEMFNMLLFICKMHAMVYIVIDGLDECSNSARNREDVILQLLRLQHEGKINLLVTSTEIPEITGLFQSFPSVEILASHSDITRYVIGRRRKLASWVDRDSDLQTLIVSEISNACGGM
jgi:Cdc6-like AAA superfamily ATPase